MKTIAPLLLVLAACSLPKPAADCTSDRDCGDTDFCVSGVCQQCETDSNCGAFNTCESGVCVQGEDNGPVDVGPAPNGYGTTPPAGFGDPLCSTGQYWTRGDRESDAMHPGGDCIQCHTERREGPDLDIAGTVMARTHDGTDCRGVPGVLVEILAADGHVAGALTSNEAGNFFATGDVAAIAPYTVRLTYEGRTVEMVTPQTDGNCMACHTVEGAEGAPGRIKAP